MLFPILGSLLYVTFWRPSMAGLGRRVLRRTFLRHELLDQQKTIYVLFTKLATWTVAIIGSSILRHVVLVAGTGTMHTRAAQDYGYRPPEVDSHHGGRALGATAAASSVKLLL